MKNEKGIGGFDLLLLSGITLCIGFMCAMLSKSGNVSFVSTSGFNCIEQAGTEPCPTNYVYRNIPKGKAIDILGQIIEHQGGEFELVEVDE